MSRTVNLNLNLVIRILRLWPASITTDVGILIHHHNRSINHRRHKNLLFHGHRRCDNHHGAAELTDTIKVLNKKEKSRQNATIQRWEDLKMCKSNRLKDRRQFLQLLVSQNQTLFRLCYSGHLGVVTDVVVGETKNRWSHWVWQNRCPWFTGIRQWVAMSPATIRR